MATSSRRPGGSSLPLWVAIAALFSMIVGLVAGLFGALSGQQPVVAAGSGGAAFTCTLTLALLVISICKR